MSISFDSALEIAKAKYPYQVDHFEEYKDYFVFDMHDDVERVGGSASPIVIRKADGAALNYAPIFFNMDAEAEEIGDVISEGTI